MSRQRKSNPPTRLSHQTASEQYGIQGKRHTVGREAEAQALLRVAKRLQDIKTGWENRDPRLLEEVLRTNRRLWTMFYDKAATEQQAAAPERADSRRTLNDNVMDLAGFVFNRTIEILTAPAAEKLDVLIAINRDIAAGLMSKPVLLPDGQEETARSIEPGGK